MWTTTIQASLAWQKKETKNIITERYVCTIYATTAEPIVGCHIGHDPSSTIVILICFSPWILTPVTMAIKQLDRWYYHLQYCASDSTACITRIDISNPSLQIYVVNIRVGQMQPITIVANVIWIPHSDCNTIRKNPQKWHWNTTSHLWKVGWFDLKHLTEHINLFITTYYYSVV